MIIKLIGITGLFLLFVSGCAGSGDLDARLKQLKDDMYTEMKNQKSDLQDNLKKDQSEVRKELAVMRNQVAEMKENQTKFSMGTEKALIDQQKQIFQIKAVADDNARRVYMIESVITARGSVVPQQTIEGFVTFIDDKKVAISLGSIHGIKTGDVFEVYKDQDKIGSIEVEVVERDSSRGFVLENAKEIAVGYRVELKKK